MAKQLGKWLDEFVENGANPNDITDWPENAGGGGSSTLTFVSKVALDRYVEGKKINPDNLLAFIENKTGEDTSSGKLKKVCIQGIVQIDVGHSIQFGHASGESWSFSSVEELVNEAREEMQEYEFESSEWDSTILNVGTSYDGNCGTEYTTFENQILFGLYYSILQQSEENEEAEEVFFIPLQLSDLDAFMSESLI